MTLESCHACWSCCLGMCCLACACNALTAVMTCPVCFAQCAGLLLFKSAGEYSVPVLLQQLLNSLEAHAGVGAQAAAPRAVQTAETEFAAAS